MIAHILRLLSQRRADKAKRERIAKLDAHLERQFALRKAARTVKQQSAAAAQSTQWRNRAAKCREVFQR